MKIKNLICAALLCCATIIPAVADAQMDSAYCKPESMGQQQRRALAGATFVTANAGLFLYFKKAWWSGEKADKFLFRPDWDQEFRDQDKFGHFLGGYHLARVGDALLRASCVSEPKAIVLAAAYATLFQLQIEIFDGMYAKYGFSYADVLANTAGMGLAVAQHYHPQLKLFKPTFSYWPTEALRSEKNSELRPSLDYSGQTYWISTDVNGLLPEEKKKYWPSIIRVSVGHSITDWIDPKTGGNLRAQRKILLSLDLDADKLPGDNPAWNRVKHTLSYIRFPAPALQITPDLKVIGLYK